MFKACPDSVDVTELQFKLQCRLKVFENADLSTFSSTNSLLTCASRYGLLFIGTNTKHFQVIETQTLQKYSPKDKDVSNYPRRNIDLPSSPKHLCVNCDSTILAVVIEKDQCSVVIFYDVISFLSQNIKVIKEIRLSSTPNIYVREINWNPSLPGIFTACKSDGSLGVYELKGNSVDINELPVAAGATCFCWSPKGKQIAVGSKDGKITQYKPDLKAVKVINEPKFENPHLLISLQWVSNYQFIGVYQSMQKESSPCVIVIDAPKTGEPSYTNYDDICYSGSSRPAQFYLIMQQNWNFFMVASANSTEVGVLGSSGDSWTQWIMSDTARAELPLSVDHQETFPVGLAFDVSSTTPLPWGESSIPPCPLLCVLSHHGVLCCFNVVYLKDGIPSICTPPDSVQDKSGLGSFVATSGKGTGLTEVVKPKSVQPSPLQLHFGAGNAQSSLEHSVVSKDNSFLVSKPTFLATTTAPSTPLVSGKSTSDISSKVLFGGSATITPIKPQQPSQGVSLFAGQTLITPIGKGSNVNTPISSSSVNQPSNAISNEKYSSIFSSLNPSTLAPTNTLPVKPIVIGGTSVTKPEAAVKAPERMTSKFLEGPVLHETSKPALIPKQELQATDPKIKAETSVMLAQMVQDEWMYLEAELKVFLNQGRNIKVNLGTDQEKVDMITQIDSLQEFVKEAVETSICQSSEIHCLKQNLIQAWAWFEEANSYYNSTKNEAVTLLLKLQPLDSVTEKRIKEIEQLSYYIESQLQQASKTLDEQWGNFQDYAKKTHRIEMPTMETIFQTMVRQSAILQKQTYVLKDISMRLKKKTFGVSSLLLSMDKTDSLADDFRQLRLDPQDILKLQYEKIKNHTKILSNKKANMLRNLLKQREVTHITAVKPQISLAMNQSPTNRTRHSVSILGAQMSPVSKTSIVKNINFNQSTPVKVSEPLKTNEISQGIRVSMGSTEKPSFTVASNTLSSSSGFVSLAKSGPVISSSQGSAFAPIGFTATSSVKPFSFGAASATSSVSQVKSSFSSPSFFTTTAVTTGPAESTTVLTSTFSLPKSPTETTVKPQSVHSTTTVSSNFTFSFGSTAPSKNVLAVTSTSNSPIVGNTPSSGNNSNSNTLFSASSNVFNSAKTQEGKTAGIAIPGTKSDVNLFQTPNLNISNSQPTSFSKPVDAVSTADKGMTLRETNIPSNIFGSHQSSFTSISKSPSVTTIPTVSSSSTPPRSSSGVASIFANLQSVIDNAVGSSETMTTTTDSLKPTFQFSTAKGAVATTTQSIFGTASKPVFGAGAATATVFGAGAATATVFGAGLATTTQSVFGNISKPVESFTPPSTTLSSVGTLNISSGTLPTSKSEILATTAVPNLHLLSTDTGTKLAESNTISKSVETSVVATTLPQTGFGQNNIVSSSNEGLVVMPTVANQTVSGDDGKITSKSEPVAFSTFQTATTTSLTNTTDMFGSIKPVTVASTSAFSTTQSGSIFSATTPSNIFGGNASTATTSSNIFASGNSSTIFGNVVTPTPASTANIFGASTSTANVIGTPAAGKSIFGAPPTPSTTSFATTTATSVFGTSATAPNIFSSSNSIFGGAPTVSSDNVFGTQTSSSSSVFGAQTTANTSIFSTTTSTPAANMFGGITPATTTSNIFASAASATPPPFGSQQSSIFGTPTTSAPVFGQKTTFGSGTPGFGTTTTTTSGNIFGSSAATSSQFGSGFGGTTTASTFESQPMNHAQPAGSFGFGGLSVGNPSSTTGSIFGGSSGGTFGVTQTANPFGKVENKLPFGSSSTNVFGNSPSPSATTNIFASPTPTASSNIFGSSSGTGFGTSSTGAGFGSPSTFGSSAFGQPPAFGSSTFGSPQTGAFSGGSASPIAQTGFGTPAAFPKPSAFGSPPAFGGSPAFGSAPSFGGSPAFGAAPSFGSPEKVFGSSPAASGGFGAAATQAQQSAGFGNLASQNTIGFGNLAQQANTQSTSPFSAGNTSFSSWR